MLLNFQRLRTNLGTARVVLLVLVVGLLAWLLWNEWNFGIRSQNLAWSIIGIVIAVALRPLMAARPRGMIQALEGLRLALWGLILVTQFSDIQFPIIVYQLIFPLCVFFIAAQLLLHSAYDAEALKRLDAEQSDDLEEVDTDDDEAAEREGSLVTDRR